MADPNSHPRFWDRYVQAPLDLVMNNPRVTTPILLLLAVTPFVMLTVILVLFFIK